MITRARTLRALVSGKLICRHSDPEAFGFLEEDDNQADVRAQLGALSLRLAITGGGAAFFATELEGTPEAERAQAADMRAWLAEFEIVKAFSDLIAGAEPGAFRLDPGQRVSAPRILAAAEGNPTLLDLIGSIGLMMGLQSRADPDQLMRVLDKLVERGLLVAVNHKARDYVITGLADRFWDIGDEFVSRIPEAAARVEALVSVQGELF